MKVEIENSYSINNRGAKGPKKGKTNHVIIYQCHRRQRDRRQSA
jgi:hypothetical protein